MTIGDFTLLFSLHLRGELARAFIKQGVTPTHEEWEFLMAVREMTARDIGEMAHRLNCEAVLSLPPIEKETT